jgi:bis(5'-nucleosyl)-tetraphosphatase (symmetrical)
MPDSTLLPPPALTPHAIGDLQGCNDALTRLLAKLPEPASTPLWFVGDLVNRGPNSLATLRQLIGFQQRATAILGNHDLHLLAVVAGVRTPKAGDTLDDILKAPDRDDLIDWLRQRPLAHRQDNFLMVHAGVLPQWDAAMVLELAGEVEQQLRGPKWKSFLAELFAARPAPWTPNLKGIERRRVTVSALTRIRFCSAAGLMEFKSTGTLAEIPPGCYAWFDVPGRKTADITMVYGHWAAAGLVLRDNLCGIDTGCVWGNRLTALPLHADPAQRIPLQVECPKTSVLSIPVPVSATVLAPAPASKAAQ